jgi:serine/threonine-protein phosphatase CPPED1
MTALPPLESLSAEGNRRSSMTTCSRHCEWVILSVLLAALAGCATYPQARWQGPFFFIQLADPQFGMYAANKDVEKEAALFGRAIDHANRLHPAFVVVCGDLVNNPGDYGQAVEFLRAAERLAPSIPLHLVSGNHDVGNTPTPDSLSRYRQWFGPDWYAFYHGGCRFVVIDTTLIHDPSRAPAEFAAQETWLNRELSAPQPPRPVHTSLFQHHPWFNQSPDEPDAYENLPRASRGRYLDWLARAHVTAVFAGHRHRNSAVRYDGFEIVASGPVGKPLGKDPSGLRIVEVYKDRIVHHYYSLDAVPERVSLAAKQASCQRSAISRQPEAENQPPSRWCENPFSHPSSGESLRSFHRGTRISPLSGCRLITGG